MNAIHGIYDALPGRWRSDFESLFRRSPFHLRYLQRCLRHPATIRADDAFLVSFPRSGSTWMRTLLTALVTGGRLDVDAVERAVPDIHQRSDAELAATPSPRLLKSHHPVNGRYPKVVYIVRDGRDVAVSYYHRRLLRGYVYRGFSDFLDRYLDGAIGATGAWQEHVLQWLDEPAMPLVTVRYEDLKVDPLRELGRAARFLEVSHDAGGLGAAVEAARFSRMRRMEREDNPGLASRPQAHAVRRGIVGDWRNYFGPADEQAFWDRCGKAMELAGYAATSS